MGLLDFLRSGLTPDSAEGVPVLSVTANPGGRLVTISLINHGITMRVDPERVVVLAATIAEQAIAAGATAQVSEIVGTMRI